MIKNVVNKAHRAFLRYAQTHPGSMTIGMLCGSTAFGLVLFRIIDDGNNEDYYKGSILAHPDSQKKMSPQEARLIAMLENAKESSWRENIQNAVDAQEQFMLPGRHRKEPNVFMDKIEDRSREILKNQHETVDQEIEKKKEEYEARNYNPGNQITYWETQERRNE